MGRLEPEWASVRIRTLIPALELEKAGCQIRLGELSPSDDELQLADVIIINKSFTQKDVDIAKRAKTLNKPVIVDLCDNIFIDNYTVLGEEALANFKQIALLADRIITTNDTLAEIIAKNIDSKSKVRIVVIPDAFDDPNAVKLIYKGLYRKELLYIPELPIFNNKNLRNFAYALYRLKKSLTSCYLTYKNRLRYCIYVLYDILDNGRLSKDRKTVIWFGNKGGSHGKFGVVCLQDIAGQLERIGKKIPIQLLVVSRGYFYFKNVTKTFSIPCHFRRWHIEEFTRLIERSDLCIIPNSQDQFSITKSNNRAVLSLMMGTPVVADSIPALESFRDFVILDDWEEGLYTYLMDSKKVTHDTNRGQNLISERYTGSKIAEAWLNLFNELSIERTV